MVSDWPRIGLTMLSWPVRMSHACEAPISSPMMMTLYLLMDAVLDRGDSTSGSNETTGQEWYNKFAGRIHDGMKTNCYSWLYSSTPFFRALPLGRLVEKPASHGNIECFAEISIGWIISEPSNYPTLYSFTLYHILFISILFYYIKV